MWGQGNCDKLFTEKRLYLSTNFEGYLNTQTLPWLYASDCCTRVGVLKPYLSRMCFVCQKQLRLCPKQRTINETQGFATSRLFLDLCVNVQKGSIFNSGKKSFMRFMGLKLHKVQK